MSSSDVDERTGSEAVVRKRISSCTPAVGGHVVNHPPQPLADAILHHRSSPKRIMAARLPRNWARLRRTGSAAEMSGRGWRLTHWTHPRVVCEHLELSIGAPLLGADPFRPCHGLCSNKLALRATDELWAELACGVMCSFIRISQVCLDRFPAGIRWFMLVL